MGDVIGMPPTLPEEDQLLVINECKFEQFEEDDGLIPQAVTPQTYEELQVNSEPELAATPHLSSQKQLDPSAAGMGEFLCTIPPISLVESAPSSAVINQTLGLGLAINNVFSLAVSSLSLPYMHQQ